MGAGPRFVAANPVNGYSYVAFAFERDEVLVIAAPAIGCNLRSALVMDDTIVAATSSIAPCRAGCSWW